MPKSNIGAAIGGALLGPVGALLGYGAGKSMDESEQPAPVAPVAPVAPKPKEEDPFLKQFKESQAGVLGSAAGQLAATQLGAKYAQEAPAELEKQQQAALASTRARAGQAFAGQMAQGGGGSLAGMRQAQLSRGLAEGQLMGDFGMQKIAAQRLAAKAQQEAAQAAGEYATTQQKLKQQEADRQRAESQELQDVQKSIQDQFDSMVERSSLFESVGTKAARRAQFVNWVQSTYGNSPNPKVQEMVKNVVDSVKKNTGSFAE